MYMVLLYMFQSLYSVIIMKILLSDAFGVLRISINSDYCTVC